MADRMSFWAWGLESEEPSEADREAMARQISERFGVAVTPKPIPNLADAELRPPRITPPEALARSASPTPTNGLDTPAELISPIEHGRSTSTSPIRRTSWPTRAPSPSSKRSSTGATREVTPSCPSVAGPRWSGVSNLRDAPTSVTIAMDRFDQVLEIDETSRAARIQAGVFGPALEEQLKPSGTPCGTSRNRSGSPPWAVGSPPAPAATTQRTTPTSTTSSSRSHADPSGWWESRRLPGSGAGPSPDRMVIGSEGILGIITEAWMRIQAARRSGPRPGWSSIPGRRHRRGAPDRPGQAVAGQPPNPRPVRRPAGPPGSMEPGAGDHRRSSRPSCPRAPTSQRRWRSPVAPGPDRRREHRVDDGTGHPTGHEGPVGEWRELHRRRSRHRNQPRAAGRHLRDRDHLGPLAGVRCRRREEMGRSCRRSATQGELSCRFTHVYPDGPAPYYTWSGWAARARRSRCGRRSRTPPTR